MTESEAIKELKEDISLYDNEITRLDASIGTPDRNLIDALEMAINALEKQIPKKPIIQKTDEKSLYKCPCCTKIFVEAYENTQRGYIPKFCEMCGQSINFRLGR